MVLKVDFKVQKGKATIKTKGKFNPPVFNRSYFSYFSSKPHSWSTGRAASICPLHSPILSRALPGLPPKCTHQLLTSHRTSSSAKGHPQVSSPNPCAPLTPPTAAPTGKRLLQAEPARLPSEPHGCRHVSWRLAGTSGIFGRRPSSWQAFCPAAFQRLTCYLCLSAYGFLYHTRKAGRLKICLDCLGLVWCPKGGCPSRYSATTWSEQYGQLQIKPTTACIADLAFQTRLGEAKGLCFPGQDCKRSLSSLCCPWAQPLFSETFLGTPVSVGLWEGPLPSSSGVE